MKHFFNQNTVFVGLVSGLGAEIGFCIALTAGLLIAGESVGDHLRWYGGMFIPILFVLRFYAKRQTQTVVTKTVATILFVTFIAFMFYLFSAHIIVLK